MTTVGFDQSRFAAVLSVVIAARGLTDRQVADQAGVAPSTITRTVRHDRNPDVTSFVRLCDWAGLSLDLFAVRTRPLGNPVADRQRRLVAAHDAARQALDIVSEFLAGETP